MAKRIRSQRRATSQRVMATIVREIEEKRFQQTVRETTTVLIVDHVDTRDPVEIARAVSAALRSA